MMMMMMMDDNDDDDDDDNCTVNKSINVKAKFVIFIKLCVPYIYIVIVK
jgi:hypothetical protein